MSYLALFVALGGVSYAAIVLPAGSVGTKQLKKKAVTKGKLANGAVTARSLATGVAISGPQGAAGPKGDPCLPVDPACVGPKGDKGDKGDPGSDAQFNGAAAGGALSGTYPNPGLGDAAVTTAKIASGAVTTGKLGHEYVTATSAYDPSNEKSVEASCPAGKRVVGAGAWITELDPTEGAVALSDSGVPNGVVSMFASAHETAAKASNWRLNVWLVCINHGV